MQGATGRLFTLTTNNNANDPMRRSFLRYTRILLLPLLAVGLVLTGCDSTGSNGGGNGDDNGSEVYPAPSNGNGYAEEIAINIQSADLALRLEGSSPSESTLEAIYQGNQGSISDENIQLTSNAVAPSATTYGELPAFVDIQSQIFKEDLLGSAELESADSDNSGTARNADDLIRFYLNETKQVSSNGVAFNQLIEKGVASALTYADAADILNDFAEDGSVASGDAEKKWNEAFGHFGAPRNFKVVLDVGGGGNGLTSGPSGGKFQDINGNNTTNLVTEGVYIWAGYTAERAAAAEATGNPNNFATRAFNAFVDGRKAIDNGNTDKLSGSDGFAATALNAWEATVAVNVIHYINSMEGNLEGLDDTKTIEDGDVGKGSWGEAKAFLWALQFESELTDSELETLHSQVGNDPPFGELTVQEYEEDLANATQTIADAYGFADENVSAW
jgi:hypothetical protein